MIISKNKHKILCMSHIDTFLFKCAFISYFKKLITVCICLFLLTQISSCYPLIGYPLRAVNRPLNQHFLGKPAKEPFTELKEIFTPFKDPHPNSRHIWGGYPIQKTFVKHYQAKGTVLYVDINDALIKGWYLAGKSESSKMYKKVAPVDLSIAVGKTGQPENVRNLNIGHEENGLFISYTNAYYSEKEVENIHVIPATPKLTKVLKNLQKYDIVYIEGFLVNWGGTGELSRTKFNTAQYAGQISHQRAGGVETGLCLQLYLTKIIFNGHIYQ